jgi:hypothetical protein
MASQFLGRLGKLVASATIKGGSFSEANWENS